MRSRGERGEGSTSYALLLVGVMAALVFVPPAFDASLSDLIFPNVCRSLAHANTLDPEVACD
jgi:hypothetical protein